MVVPDLVRQRTAQAVLSIHDQGTALGSDGFVKVLTRHRPRTQALDLPRLTFRTWSKLAHFCIS